MNCKPKQMSPWDFAIIKRICTEHGLPVPELSQYVPSVKRRVTTAMAMSTNSSRRYRRRIGSKTKFTALKIDAKVKFTGLSNFNWELGRERRPEYSRFDNDRASPSKVELHTDRYSHTIGFCLGQVYYLDARYHVIRGAILVEYEPGDALSYIPAMILNALIHNKEGAAKDILVGLLRFYFSEKDDGIQPDAVIGLDRLRKEIVNTLYLKLDLAKSQKLKLGRRHILLYGAPGNGKTLLIRNICQEFQKNAIIVCVRGYDQFEKWVPLLSLVANMVSIPIILIADEIDEMARAREHETRTFEFLRLMDGVVAMPNVVFLATTNRPDLLDPALLRPERFSPAWEVPWPDGITRKLMFLNFISRYRKITDDGAQELAKATEKWSGADIRAVVEDVVYDVRGEISHFTVEAVRARIRERTPEIQRIHGYWNILIGKWRKTAETGIYIG